MSVLSSFVRGTSPWPSWPSAAAVPGSFPSQGFRPSPIGFNTQAPTVPRPVAWGAPSAGSSFAQPTSSASASRPLVIAEIDQFTTTDGFNHGQEISRILTSGGNDPALSGRIQLLPYNVAGSNTTANIASALQDVVRRAMSGQTIDAVNISQQSFGYNPYTPLVRQYIGQLSSMGIPVAVAAGNFGPSNVNQLAPANSFIVRSAQNGRINSDSGPGNIVSNGTSTSFATANLTPTLAKLKASGYSLPQIFSQVSSMA